MFKKQTEEKSTAIVVPSFVLFLGLLAAVLMFFRAGLGWLL